MLVQRTYWLSWTEVFETAFVVFFKNANCPNQFHVQVPCPSLSLKACFYWSDHTNWRFDLRTSFTGKSLHWWPLSPILTLMTIVTRWSGTIPFPTFGMKKQYEPLKLPAGLFTVAFAINWKPFQPRHWCLKQLLTWLQLPTFVSRFCASFFTWASYLYLYSSCYPL